MEDRIVVNGVNYVKEQDGEKHVIIRSAQAGVFAGYLKSFNETTCVAILTHSRRLWQWFGAASISQIAIDGVSKPNNCKFPQEINSEHTITRVIEIIPTTEKARLSITELMLTTGQAQEAWETASIAE